MAQTRVFIIKFGLTFFASKSHGNTNSNVIIMARPNKGFLKCRAVLTNEVRTAIPVFLITFKNHFFKSGFSFIIFLAILI
jgi:hypothetical protein